MAVTVWLSPLRQPSTLSTVTPNLRTTPSAPGPHFSLLPVGGSRHPSSPCSRLLSQISAGTDTAAASQMDPTIFGITYRGRSQSTSEWRVPAIADKGQKMEVDVRQMVQEMVYDTSWARNSTLTFM